MTKLKLALGICLGMLVTITIMAMADYTGPDRSETRILWERKNCHYQAVYDPPGPGSYGCYLDLYFSPTGSCPTEGTIADYFNPSVCTSWPGSCGELPCSISGGEKIVSCASGQSGCTEREESYALPPASVSGVTSCALPGKNGWCRGAGTLSLTSHEPLAGYTVTGIEGSNGLLCPGSSCQWSFPEGETTTDFWALSSYGDTSLASSAIMRIDITPPETTLKISGNNPNTFGWYKDFSSLSAAVTGVDTNSGVGDLLIQLNGREWQRAPLSFPGDGTYAVSGRAVDLAGNETTTPSQVVRIDSTPPNLDLQVDRAPDQGSWYLSPVGINASAFDALSGLGSLSASLEDPSGTLATVSLPATISQEGENVFRFEAFDQAGNTTRLSQTLSLDLTPPTIRANVTGVEGTQGWYTSPITVTFSAADAAAGVRSLQIRASDGSWQDGTEVEYSEDGIYSFLTRATDNVGRETEQEFTLFVDQTPPQFAPVLTGQVGQNGWYVGPVTIAANALDATSGIADVLPSPEILLADTGTHAISWTAMDSAGNSSSYSLPEPIRVDLDAPFISIDPLPGPLSGIVTLSGKGVDPDSGIAQVLLSTNRGQDFQEINLDDSGNWNFPWNTDEVQGWTTDVIVRAVDLAGNRSEVGIEVHIVHRRGDPFSCDPDTAGAACPDAHPSNSYRQPSPPCHLPQHPYAYPLRR